VSSHAHVQPASHAALGDAHVVLERPESAYELSKRVLDIVVAATLLLMLAPLMLLVALVIRLDSPGPALFFQERVGARKRRGSAYEWDRTIFKIVKFRTMSIGADAAVHAAHVRLYAEGRIAGATQDGRAPFKLHDDPRVTRVGRLLRRASFDELPQLINVLRGQMSLVGPRPVPLYEAELCVGDDRLRFAAVPGITGPWQVSGRCAVPWAEMVRLDCEYVQRRSLRVDLKIIALTVPAIITGKGAG
jgi:lipopolysaccharide/colanic/teichoic acid biosynthesis glycosyltransferase